jgi:hypothetical protein
MQTLFSIQGFGVNESFGKKNVVFLSITFSITPTVMDYALWFLKWYQATLRLRTLEKAISPNPNSASDVGALTSTSATGMGSPKIKSSNTNPSPLGPLKSAFSVRNRVSPNTLTSATLFFKVVVVFCN